MRSRRDSAGRRRYFMPSRQCNPFTTVRYAVAPFSPAHLSPNRRAKVVFQPAHDFLTDFRNLGVVESAVRRAEH
ncbi:MAG: hypothetical protein KatS3mg058_1815 [Roseiflexus sp.]|nr:MAG: hypothetical protein KatS3mg058_1815 [Roseiflexus sp.]